MNIDDVPHVGRGIASPQQRGRLVVGELFGDTDSARFAVRRERALRTGLRFGRRLGGPPGYFAGFYVGDP
jgi:hypothetical protein